MYEKETALYAEVAIITFQTNNCTNKINCTAARRWDKNVKISTSFSE